MNRRLARLLSLCAASAVTLGAITAAGGWANADDAAGPSQVTDGMPSQSVTDVGGDGAGSGQASWSDIAGGVAARPYVVSMSVDNGGVVTPIITGGTTATPDPAQGGLGAVISPMNLCAPGQSPASGQCYSSPNRVALTVVYGTGPHGPLGHNFAEPSTPVSPEVNASSVIDMTVALNTLGRTLGWSMVTGELLYWHATDLGQADATVHVRFRPTITPWVNRFPDNNGCTATPIFNCAIPTADADMLTAGLLLSLDGTGDTALSGAVFGVQHALSGYLEPGGSAAAPTLNFQLASSHTQSDGSPQLGTLQALLPASTLEHLYGLLPLDAASVFTTSRGGDAGSNAPPVYAPWTAVNRGTDGLMITIPGITFSVPSYQVRSAVRILHSRALVGPRFTTVEAHAAGCTAAKLCVAAVYNLGHGKIARSTAYRPVLVGRARVTTSRVLVRTLRARLHKGDTYLIVVRTGKKQTVLYTGTVVIK